MIVFGLIAWLGQGVSAISPSLAIRLGLIEPPSDVNPVFYADARAGAVWDLFIGWTLPLAGTLLVLGVPQWAYFGLVGSGVYLYFAGRGIAQRVFMQRSGISVGRPNTLRAAYAFLVLWGLIALVTISLAAFALRVP